MRTIIKLSSAIRMILLMVIIATLSTAARAQVSHKVSVANYSFNPSQITIQVGDTVIWENTDGSHNVNGTKTTFPSNPEDFGNNVGTNWTYKFVFTKPGTYNYQCDPHIDQGMVGKVIVNGNSGEDAKLTIQFTGMTPHIGQELTVYLRETNTGEYKDTNKVNEIESASFNVVLNDLQIGKSYMIDFYADLNGNNSYDVPPVDHAWRININNVQGDVVLDFAHNTNFTDIFAVATNLDFVELSENLLVYPNPANRYINVSLSSFSNDAIFLNVYSSTGLLLSKSLIQSGQNNIMLDISWYSQGVYFLELISGNSREFIKIIKE